MPKSRPGMGVSRMVDASPFAAGASTPAGSAWGCCFAFPFRKMGPETELRLGPKGERPASRAVGVHGVPVLLLASPWRG